MESCPLLLITQIKVLKNQIHHPSTTGGGEYNAADMEFCIILLQAKISNLQASTILGGFLASLKSNCTFCSAQYKTLNIMEKGTLMVPIFRNNFLENPLFDVFHNSSHNLTQIFSKQCLRRIPCLIARGLDLKALISNHYTKQVGLTNKEI